MHGENSSLARSHILFGDPFQLTVTVSVPCDVEWGGGGERHQQDEQFDGLGRRFLCSYKWAACYRLSPTLVGYLSAAS